MAKLKTKHASATPAPASSSSTTTAAKATGYTTTTTTATAAAAAQHYRKPKYSLWNIWVAGFFLKLLLFTTYHSTDFDVHRNWLAITAKLPLSQWYFEKTSQWTLDYPPFFAYFEYALAQLVPSSVARDGCLDIVPKGEYGLLTVFYQRLTVILSEGLLFIVLQWYINSSGSDSSSISTPAGRSLKAAAAAAATARSKSDSTIHKQKQKAFVVASSLALSPGFFIIDHIHFQYNGFLFAFIIASVVFARQQRYLLCGAAFAIALCFKHIFLYLAPAYGIFLLRAYCLDFNFSLTSTSSWQFRIKWGNLFKLGSLVVFIFAVAFGPFIYLNQVPQLLTRLFPFSRGLTHAYWAPNFWAVYSIVDRVLSQLSLHVPLFSEIMQRFNFPQFNKQLILAKQASMDTNTKGLVQDVYFTILPNIQPKFTFMLTLFYQILAVVLLFVNPTFNRFLGSLTLCGFASFLFGWHVHEKAIMLVIVPFSFLALNDRRFLSSFHVLIASGYVSLFPLLFIAELWPLKVLYTYVWCLIYFASFKAVATVTASIKRRIFFFDRLTLIYIIGLVPLVVLTGLLDALGDRAGVLGKLQFFRLMCISVYCSLGVIGSWLGLSWLYFFDELLWL